MSKAVADGKRTPVSISCLVTVLMRDGALAIVSRICRSNLSTVRALLANLVSSLGSGYMGGGLRRQRYDSGGPGWPLTSAPILLISFFFLMFFPFSAQPSPM
jgi:hypothetical protein